MSAEAEAAAKEKTVFMQVFRQLANLPPSCLRHNERAFKVTLKGERVEGEGKQFLLHFQPNIQK